MFTSLYLFCFLVPSDSSLLTEGTVLISYFVKTLTNFKSPGNEVSLNDHTEEEEKREVEERIEGWNGEKWMR